MSNEIIFIRFYGQRAGEVPAVRPQLLSAMCTAIEHIYEISASTLGVPAGIELHFARPPALGCLEIALKPEGEEPEKPDPDHSRLTDLIKWLAVTKDVATIGGVIWLVAFGDAGVVDMLRRKPETVDVTPLGDPVRLLVSQELVIKEVQTLLNSAAATQADRVEMELPNGSKITLFSASENADPFLVARQAYRLSDVVRPGQKTGSIRRTGAAVLKGSWDGKPAFLFVGSTDFHPINGPKSYAVVWVSSRPLPEINSDTEYRGFVVAEESRSRLRVEASVPEPLQRVSSGILVIEQVPDWG